MEKFDGQSGFADAERKLAEEARNQLAAIVESSEDAIIGNALDGTILSWNTAAQRIFGYCAEEIVGRPITVLVPPEFLDEEKDILETLKRGKKVRRTRAVRLRKDGSRVDVSLTVSPVKDDSGRMVGAARIARGVTGRTRAEQLLRESEGLKGAILESAIDCIIGMDHEGKVIEWNPAAEQTFGYRRADVLGREMAALIIPPALREKHRRGLAHFLATGQGPALGKRIEMTAIRADGREFPIELAITRVQCDGPPAFTGYVRDITDRKRTEEARDQLAAIVEHAEDAIISKTYDGTIVTWNAGAQRIFGYRAQEIVGRPISLLIPPELCDEETGILEKLKQGKRIEHYETV
ncbi:MAG: PAS domain-containing sensor histidine kinase, partial [Verrucomicrobia bacterium]